MTRGSRRRWTAIACCLVAFVCLLAGGGRLLERLDAWREKAEIKVGERLDARHGLIMLATMDGAHPREAVSYLPVHVRQCDRVSGRIRDARRINLDQDTFLRVDAPRRIPGSEATYAAWFRPKDCRRRQVLFNCRSRASGFILFLESERLALHVNLPTAEVTDSCQYVGKKDRFTHVAVAFSSDAAVIYQNGHESLRIQLPCPASFPRKPVIFGRTVFWPFEGDIDEMAIWGRSLDALELIGVVRSRGGICVKYEPVLTLWAVTAGRLSAALSATMRVFDRLVPNWHGPGGLAKNLAIFSVWPSKADERHFVRVHAQSTNNGFRTRKAASFRRINVVYNGHLLPLDIALDDIYAEEHVRRMAFLVRDETRTLFGGSGLARLYPPELHAVLHPDASYPLPLSATFIRLYFHNEFHGLYVIEPFDREGSGWMAYGSHVGPAKNAIGFKSSKSSCDEPPPGLDANDAFNRVAALVASDVFFPWSRQELQAKRRRQNLIWLAHNFDVLKHPGAPGFLGRNLSPLYVTDDLVLPGAPEIQWKSSAPEIVSETGRVTRPESGAPRSVLLAPVDSRTGGIGDCQLDAEPLRVRVIPLRPALQTLFLHVGSTVDKYVRKDFSCMLIPAGGGDTQWLTGTAATGGGLHHRGNTSYVKGAKRSLSLKFDQTVALMEDGLPSNHLLLLSGYADPTRLRNRISFDTFRAAAAGRVPNGITAIDWAEVFINGEYYGVWELAHRVRDSFPAEEGLLYKIRAHDQPIWSTTSPDMAEAISLADPRTDAAQPLEDLFAITCGANWNDFTKVGVSHLLVDSFVDYLLMLNFTQNQDGQLVNQFLARDAISGKWFFIPWDYDKTFFNGSAVPLGNKLLTHLVDDVPEFSRAAAAKWKTLRGGALSDDAMLARIDSYAERLAPYMEEEYRLRQPDGWNGDFPNAVERLKAVVRDRLHLLDNRFGEMGK